MSEQPTTAAAIRDDAARSVVYLREAAKAKNWTRLAEVADVVEALAAEVDAAYDKGYGQALRDAVKMAGADRGA